MPPRTLIDPQRLATVESYRRHLAEHWQIRPYTSSADVDALLDPNDRSLLKHWRRQLLATADTATHARFYDWLAHPRRFGPVHSLKWMETLAGGIWAAAALARFAPQGPVLDLGSGAGYWTIWLAAQRSAPVVGVDACAAAIALGRQRLTEAGLPGELRCADFEQTISEHAFVAAVSLQGLTRHFHAAAFDVLAKVAANLGPGGHLVLVDELPGLRADYDRAFAAAGLTLVAAGPVGGLGIDDEWKSYTGLMLQSVADAASRGPSLERAESAVEQIWHHVHPFATAERLDATQRNTAYWWSGGAEALVRF